jgi:hypothetical protein
MSLLMNILSAFLAVSSLAYASPVIGSAKGRPEEGDKVEVKTNFPTFYNIYPGSPDLFKTPVGDLRLETWQSKSQVEQVVIYKNIPATAKNCKLSFEVGPKVDRVFLTRMRREAIGYEESHQIDVHSVKGYPTDGKITYNAVKGIDSQFLSSFDVKHWDDFEQPSRVHSIDVPCAPELAFKLGYKNVLGEKTLFLQTTVKNGLFLEYNE